MDCPLERFSREAQLSVPPPELGDRSFPVEGAQTAGGHQRQQRCPNQSFNHIRMFRSEVFERLGRCEFTETEFHFPPHRIRTRHFFRGQHLGPEVREAEVVLSGLLVALQGGSPRFPARARKIPALHSGEPMSNDNKARKSAKNALVEKIVRWELEARGRVQRVGYRDMVEEAARVLNLVGKVGNDPEDDQLVHVVVQGPESTLSEFVKAISGRHGFADATIRTGNTGEPDPKLVRFTKERGSPEKETLERADQSVLILDNMASTLGDLREETHKGFSDLGTTMDKGFTSLGAKMDHLGDKMDRGFRDSIASSERLHKDFTVRFNRVDASYGMIGKTLARMDKNLEKLTKAILALAQESHRAARAAPTETRAASRSKGRKHAFC